MGVQKRSFEAGRRKVSASMLPKLSTLFGISVDELVGMKTQAAKRGPASRLQQQMEQISQLPRSRQKLISEMLDGVIGQRKSA